MADATLEDAERYYFGYDERWRMVASFRNQDASPKETFVYHAAGSIRRSVSDKRRAAVAADLNRNGEGPGDDSGDSDLFDESYTAHTGMTGKGRLSAGGIGSASPTGTFNRKGYAGYEWDPVISMYHVRYRVYHPAIGRWMRRDPLGYVDGIGVYEYVQSNASRFVDSGGTCVECLSQVWFPNVIVPIQVLSEMPGSVARPNGRVYNNRSYPILACGNWGCVWTQPDQWSPYGPDADYSFDPLKRGWWKCPDTFDCAPVPGPNLAPGSPQHSPPRPLQPSQSSWIPGLYLACVNACSQSTGYCDDFFSCLTACAPPGAGLPTCPH